MAYQALARKWRPKKFADLVGQEHVVKALQNALDKGRLHHAYLLTGTRGVGKTTIARILAKSLNCESPAHGEPCGECQSCRDIDAGRFVDLLEIDAASNTGIDNIREVLENAQYAPTVGKYKVYIIDEVHMLSKSAFNAMLKTLEEPPEHVKFILATTDPHKVPITVLSRCLQFVLRNMTAQQVSNHLAYVLDKEQITYEMPALTLLSRAAAGSMRDALSLLDQAIAMGSGNVSENDVREMIGAVDKYYLYELLTFLMAQNGEALMAKAQEMAANAIGFDGALNDLAILLQRLALIQTVPTAIAADDPERNQLLELAQHFSSEQIQLYYQCIIHGKQDLALAPDEYAGFVMTLLRMLAFAPFAAKNTPSNAHIVDSQLNNPVVDSKVPVEMVGQTSSSSTVYLSQIQAATDNVSMKNAAQFTDESGVEHSSDRLNHQAPIEIEADNNANHKQATSSSANFPNDEYSKLSSIDTTNANKQIMADKIDVSNENVNNENIKSESLVSHIQNEESPPWQMENIASATTVDVANAGINIADKQTNYIPNEKVLSDAEFISESPVYLEHNESNLAEQIHHTTPREVALPDETNEVKTLLSAEIDDNLPMPEFIAQNWPQIAARIGTRIAVAQLVLLHLAWIHFDENSNLLTLALMQEETKATVSREYLSRIADALSEAYQRPIRLQTQPWQDGMGWETPLMYHHRMAMESRERAKQNMEADSAVQALQQIFGAKWLENSISEHHQSSNRVNEK